MAIGNAFLNKMGGASGASGDISTQYKHFASGNAITTAAEFDAVPNKMAQVITISIQANASTASNVAQIKAATGGVYDLVTENTWAQGTSSINTKVYNFMPSGSAVTITPNRTATNQYSSMYFVQ